ncbi:nicotinate-nucleotide--dimethylbenzimidazole phosphoribosyltransferase [Clostridiales bacterium PH28_bin88]|nr:nicotinate-nucleotide--dimethylbenzimidazole phosphoribosyltransferase [Clostridiales bacterium PH28_bin88]
MEKLRVTMQRVQPVDREVMAQTQARLDSLTKPPGSLGVLEDIARQVAGITRQVRPQLLKKCSVLMAADHGVVAEGVSAFPREVTPQMVLNFARGGAAMNVLARHVGAELVLVDIGVAADLPDMPGLLKKKVAYGTANMAQGPAMTGEQAVRAVEVGIEIVEGLVSQGFGLIGTGEMGIGNTTPSTAIVAAFSGLPVEEVVGRGTGVDDARLRSKIQAIERALEVNRPDPGDPLDVLSKVGGLEIAGLAGVMLGAAANQVPVMVDGFISGAAALVATRLSPAVKDYLIGSHLSEEPGHKVMLESIGIKPMLHMHMRLGEGTGAALAMTLVDAAIKILNEMATFADAGVSSALDCGGME